MGLRERERERDCMMPFNLTIEIGDKIPEFTFKTAKIIGNGEGCSVPEQIKSLSIFSGKTVILIGVPGAFTPTCSGKHIPGYLEKLDELRKLCVDAVAVTSVNDAFVMAYWADEMNASERIQFLADGNGVFARLIGMQQDLTSKDMGMRSRRYALLVRDGIVKYIGIDDDTLEKSSVNALLTHLKQ